MVRVKSPLLSDGIGQVADYLYGYPHADAGRLRQIANHCERVSKTSANNLRIAAKHREWLDNNAPGWLLQIEYSPEPVRMIEFPNDTAALLYKLSF